MVLIICPVFIHIDTQTVSQTKTHPAPDWFQVRKRYPNYIGCFFTVIGRMDLPTQKSLHPASVRFSSPSTKAAFDFFFFPDTSVSVNSKQRTDPSSLAMDDINCMLSGLSSRLRSNNMAVSPRCESLASSFSFRTSS